MYHWFKKYFIPTPHNDHKPHFFRERAVTILVVIVVLGFAGSILQRFALEKMGGRGSLAAVISSVLVDLTNESRLAANVSAPTLVPNALLAEAAQLKANDMALKGYFAHNSPDGKTPWYWFQSVGYDFSNAGENLAVNFSDSEEVVNAWMNSPGHRANIVNGKYTEVGIATAEGMYQGRDTIFVVQLFGKPKSTSVAVTPVSASTTVASVPVSNTSSPLVSAVGAAVEGAATSAPVVEVKPKISVVKKPAPPVTPSITTSTPAESESSSTSTGAAVATDDSPIEPGAASSFLPQSTIVEKLMTSPKLALNTIYLILSVIVLLALGLMIFIKINIQHPRNIFYGVALILLMTGLAFAGTALFHPHLTIAFSSLR